MAHDSDIDSWDLRPDFSSHSYCRNDPRRASHSRTYINDVFQDHENQSISSSNDCSRFPTRTRLSLSGSDVRFINPAIYAESLTTEDRAPRSIIEANCGDSAALIGRLSSLSIRENSNPQQKSEFENQHGDHHQNGRRTYRCNPLSSPTTPSTLISSRDDDSKRSLRVLSCRIGESKNNEKNEDCAEQPEVQRYDLNGTRIVEFSTTSRSSLSDQSSDRLFRAKKRAHEEWVERKRAEEALKKEEARKVEMAKKTEEERLGREREERERENYLQWTEKKKKKEAEKRETIERNLEFERLLKEVEDKTVVTKTIFLRQWARKKEQQQKALEKKQETRKKREDEERKKRLEESEKAYVKWKETSKNRPRPATQGLLPHQKATPSYVNPNPWITDIEEYGDTTKNQSIEVKKTSESRNSVRKSIDWKQ